MAYLPDEEILIEADLFDSVDTGVADSVAAPLYEGLLNNVRTIGLDVETIAPIHGPAASWDDFLKAAGKAGVAP